MYTHVYSCIPFYTHIRLHRLYMNVHSVHGWTSVYTSVYGYICTGVYIGVLEYIYVYISVHA